MRAVAVSAVLAPVLELGASANGTASVIAATVADDSVVATTTVGVAAEATHSKTGDGAADETGTETCAAVTATTAGRRIATATPETASATGSTRSSL